MQLAERVKMLAQWGEHLQNLSSTEKETLYERAFTENPWFTSSEVERAWQHVCHCLSQTHLQQCMSLYEGYFQSSSPKRVGIVMAGNLPMVGFSDLLSVLLAGHYAYIKPSHKDKVLMQFLTSSLQTLQPAWSTYLHYPTTLKEVQALVVMGSQETYEHFARYFSHVPFMLRGQKNSCAILQGNEPAEELQLLGKDIFHYYGMGCRSITKVYLPAEYRIAQLYEAWEGFQQMAEHYKYRNNYEYYKSIYLINSIKHWDNHFLILTEDDNLCSPIGVLYYQHYDSPEDLHVKLRVHEKDIQIIATNLQAKEALLPAAYAHKCVPLGSTQQPNIWDNSRENLEEENLLLFLEKLHHA